jgi:hypothetical protein
MIPNAHKCGSIQLPENTNGSGKKKWRGSRKKGEAAGGRKINMIHGKTKFNLSDCFDGTVTGAVIQRP